ncbi:hypothetical protein DCAR_0205284 [Daucus carota subsp. sativus]|uniref:Uncharacterized protein n=1 Tax=Daucus carota subsp. sativus TaxID=79200 RepID=A0AAF1AMZ4_DAUCS|nr:hypothetical protein DCAR_0205284 [Daucus carota subsp. sativus]
MPGYTIWYFHGEGDRSRVNIGTSSRNVGCTDDFYDAREMLDDFVNATGHFENDEEPNAAAKNFYKMLDSASQPIYPDNTRFTTLSFVNKLLQFKHKHGCSNKGFDELLQLIGSVLPNDHNLPTRYYDVKKLVSGLNMGYQKIDACDSEKIYCDICNESRYKAQKDHKKKMIPQKILRYFPLTLRLQRLFMSEKTAKCMTWHHDRVVVEDQLSHPADGDEWKQFDLNKLFQWIKGLNLPDGYVSNISRYIAETVHTRLRRNEVPRVFHDPKLLEVYTYPAQPILRTGCRLLSSSEHRLVKYYVLINSPEVAKYLW